MIEYSEGPSVKLTLWLMNHCNAQGIDGEDTDGEEVENDFYEHDDRDCCEKEQITAAPGLMFWRWKRRSWVGCAVAEALRNRETPRLFYRFLGPVDAKF